MKYTLFLLIIFLYSSVNAQEASMSHADSSRIFGHVYYVNAWTSIAISGGGGLLLLGARLSPYFGKTDISNQEFDALQSASGRSSLNALDRLALNLKVPTVDYTWTAVGIQIVCGIAPFSLFFSDQFSKNWDDITLMLLETNVITTSIFQFSPFGPSFQNKYRPIAYYATTQSARDSIRSGDTRNSFYSGHTSSAAASLYFMAKVYCDYHPDIHGWDKIGIYALASIPPMLMGYFRLIALRHFPTDILTGFIVGGAVGIAVPEIHRIATKDKGLSFTPYISPAGSGMSLTYNFK